MRARGGRVRRGGRDEDREGRVAHLVRVRVSVRIRVRVRVRVKVRGRGRDRVRVRVRVRVSTVLQPCSADRIAAVLSGP